MPVRIYTNPGTVQWSVPAYGQLIIECWGPGGGGASANFSTNSGGTGSSTSASGPLAAGGSFTLTAAGGGGGQGGVFSYFTSSTYYSRPVWFAVDQGFVFRNPLIGGTSGSIGGAGGTASGGNATNTAGSAAGYNGGNAPTGFYGRAGGTGGTYPAGAATAPGGGGAGSAFTASVGTTVLVYSTFYGTSAFGSETNYATLAGTGGGSGSYSRSQFSSGDITPGQLITLTVGSGGGGSVEGSAGAAGRIVVTWSEIPPPVTSVSPLSINSISAAFLALNGVVPAKPWSLGQYRAFYLQNQQGGTQYPDTRVLNYGVGIQDVVGDTYDQKVPFQPLNLPIAFQQFFGTFQILEMRYPQAYTAPSGPIANSWAQWDTIVFPYTGNQQIFYFYNARIIKIECWGASAYYFGGRTTTSNHSLGGYSSGIYVNPAAVGFNGGVLYVYVGGAPDVRNTTGIALGGYNGGGDAYTGSGNLQRGAGGGATDVRLLAPPSNPPRGYSATNYAYWSNTNTVTSLNSRLVTAGGGGGPSFTTAFTPNYRPGGIGGGLIAGNGDPVETGSNGLGGTQDAAGAGGSGTFSPRIYAAVFGLGGGSLDTNTSNVICGGGGGWYGGGAGFTAGGGSGHMDTNNMLSDTEAPKFGGVNLTVRSNEVNYVANPVAGVNSGANSVFGNGYCRITILG